MIVVTTPTGNIGHHVVQNLLDAGKQVRVIVRDPAKLQASVRDRVEVIEGSHGDAAVIDRAFAGADAVFWVCPADVQRTLEEAFLDFTRPAAEALARHGVARVVSITGLGRGTAWARKAGHVTVSLAMDAMLMASGAAFRGLAVPSFMDNTLQQIESIKAQGVIYGPFDPDSKMPTIATRDIGVEAARLLADATWTGQEEVVLVGPEDLSFNDMAATLADVLRRDVRYQQIPFDAFKAQLAQAGMSESFQQGFVDMTRAKNEGMDNVAEAEPGAISAPTSYRQWCVEELQPAMAG